MFNVARNLLLYLLRWAHPFVLIFACTSLHAQIEGIVTSSKDQSRLDDVEVFINQTTVATTTDESGQFQLQNIPDGFMELVLYKKGFEIFRSAVTIQGGRSYNLKLQLQPSAKKMGKRATSGEVATVSKTLIGEERARVENPGDLLVANTNGVTLYSSPVPIRIKNERTALTVHVYLQGADQNSLAAAPIRFELDQANDMASAIELEGNRIAAYHGSLVHWLRSIYINRTQQEGFVMKANGVEVGAPSITTITASLNRARIAFPSELSIQYQAANGTVRESIVSASGPIVIHRGGSIINPQLLSIRGDMSSIPIAAHMPIDYTFTEGNVQDAFAKSVRNQYEKIYVQTDKPYYYPGEMIWAKAYLMYYTPNEVSRVVHLELLDSSKRVTAQRTLRIERRTARGDIALPDQLTPGLYYLRAYTNSNLNFGSEHLFVKPIRVLPPHEKVLSPHETYKEVRSRFLSIEPDRSTYKPRDLVTLNLQAIDALSQPTFADLAISVTDAIQVVPIDEFTTIESLTIDTLKVPPVKDFKFRVEQGVSFRGQFVDDKGRPTQSMLGFTQSATEASILVETDDQGLFELRDLQHFDTATYLFNSDRSKKYAIGKIKPTIRTIPDVHVPQGSFEIPTVKSESIQRLPSAYLAQRDVRMLQEVEVVGKKIEPQEIDRTRRPFGKGDFVFTSKDFNPNHDNILLTLQGRIPGLSVRQDNGVWTVTLARSSALSFANNQPMTVMIDNVIINGDAFSVLAGINPISVESVEVTTRPTVIYGERSAAGMIAIYMKQGYTYGSSVPNFQEIRIPGYSLPSVFSSPDYSDPTIDASAADYRSLIYWDPAVRLDAETGKAAIQFYAADLPGRYRIVVEGVTASGQVVRSVAYITVDD